MSLSIEDLFRNDDYRKRNITLLLFALSLIAWLYLLWEFRKWGAQWGPINVLIIAVLAAAVIGWWISRRTWYRDQSRPTRWRLFIIPAAGFILCAAGGIYFTEPLERGGQVTRSDNSAAVTGLAMTVDRRSPSYRYDYNLSRASDYHLFSSLLDLGGSVDDADVDEGCFAILLVLLVIALVIGSLMIPHFWILSTFVLLVIMALFAHREWRLAARREKPSVA